MENVDKLMELIEELEGMAYSDGMDCAEEEGWPENLEARGVLRNKIRSVLEAGDEAGTVVGSEPEEASGLTAFLKRSEEYEKACSDEMLRRRKELMDGNLRAYSIDQVARRSVRLTDLEEAFTEAVKRFERAKRIRHSAFTALQLVRGASL